MLPYDWRKGGWPRKWSWYQRLRPQRQRWRPVASLAWMELIGALPVMEVTVKVVASIGISRLNRRSPP
eukprot:symbB.v1.2.036700.t1/scaffold5238.1/size29499/2